MEEEEDSLGEEDRTSMHGCRHQGFFLKALFPSSSRPATACNQFRHHLDTSESGIHQALSPLQPSRPDPPSPLSFLALFFLPPPNGERGKLKDTILLHRHFPQPSRRRRTYATYTPLMEFQLQGPTFSLSLTRVCQALHGSSIPPPFLSPADGWDGSAPYTQVGIYGRQWKRKRRRRRR